MGFKRLKNFVSSGRRLKTVIDGEGWCGTVMDGKVTIMDGEVTMMDGG